MSRSAPGPIAAVWPLGMSRWQIAARHSSALPNLRPPNHGSPWAAYHLGWYPPVLNSQLSHATAPPLLRQSADFPRVGRYILGLPRSSGGELGEVVPPTADQPVSMVTRCYLYGPVRFLLWATQVVNFFAKLPIIMAQYYSHKIYGSNSTSGLCHAATMRPPDALGYFKNPAS
ncbi:hypothetical protein B0H14DRAFT_2603496 [Mycena olivaceomarginata]|nr:hypothetical protein B0H14DRAFT_2603496 [Mycena olivaceomarginata]